MIVERTGKPGMPIRIRLNDGNHDFTEKAAVELVEKLASIGVVARTEAKVSGEQMTEWALEALDEFRAELPAPQSPVVPGVATGHDIVDFWRKTSAPIWEDIPTAQGEWKRLSDMIDAHLLANARESRYTLADLELMWGHGKRDVPLSEALATVGKEG